MWNSLPLPRVESLNNGTEFYISLDKDGFIKIVNNLHENTSIVDIISPSTEMSIGKEFIGTIDRANIVQSAKDHSFFNAPENSYFRNPVLDNITLTRPIAVNTSVDSSSLPTFDNVTFDPDNFEIGVAGPSCYKGKAPEANMPNINFE
jgi:hypothetical protein